VRRVCKRLYRRRTRRTRDLAPCMARRPIAGAPADAVLVFEDLSRLDAPGRRLRKGPALCRRLALWRHRAIRQAVVDKPQRSGIRVAEVDPAYTGQTCNRCGRRGIRKRHAFTCPACGYTAHADPNAARNIRDRFVQVLLDGEPSISSEAQYGSVKESVRWLRRQIGESRAYRPREILCPARAATTTLLAYLHGIALKPAPPRRTSPVIHAWGS